VFLMTWLVLSSLGLIIIVILLYLTYVNLTFVNSIDYKQLVYGQLEKQSWYDKLVEAKVVGEAIVVDEAIDELQYFVNGVRRPFEEFEKAWPRKDNREKKE
jgi:hypothetical protein